MRKRALVYSEGNLGHLDGKVTNGLVRHSEKHKIVGVIDSTKTGLDAGEFLDGKKNNIRVFSNIASALDELGYIPDYFIYGIAPITSYLDKLQREIMFYAMKRGMNIINGLPEFFTDDAEFIQKAEECGVEINDVRKPPPRKDLHLFKGTIFDLKTPVITVFGTDCAVGKRTTAISLVTALRESGLKTEFVATGQTGLLQGAKYGVAVDVLSSGFQTGEVENEVLRADRTEHPDIIVVEGQGALSHPAFTSSTAIMRGAMPDAVILQHSPKRKYRCDFPAIPVPTLESEIKLVELISGVKVIGITINPEDMSREEAEKTIEEYENKFNLPVADILVNGGQKLVERIVEEFPHFAGLNGSSYANLKS